VSEVGIEPTREAVEMRVPKVPFWISLALSLLLAVLIAACVKWLVFEFVLPLARVATGRQILRPVISAGDILVTSVVIVCTVGSLLGSAKSSRATSTNSKPSRVSWSAGCAGSSNPDHKFQTSFSSPRPPFMSTVCAYVGDYEQQLSVVVGEEDYTQRVFDRNLVGREVPRTRRRLRSEFAILRLPTDEKRWIGVRDVLEVDGRRIPDRAGRLTALLKLPFGAAEVQWRALEEESARFNIGNVVRTLNVPTFVLLFLRCDNLRRLEFDARQPDGGEVVVDYREMQRPTFIRDTYGEDEFARDLFVRMLRRVPFSRPGLRSVWRNATCAPRLTSNSSATRSCSCSFPAKCESSIGRRQVSVLKGWRCTGISSVSKLRRAGRCVPEGLTARCCQVCRGLSA